MISAKKYLNKGCSSSNQRCLKNNILLRIVDHDHPVLIIPRRLKTAPGFRRIGSHAMLSEMLNICPDMSAKPLARKIEGKNNT